jgi:acetyl-CoA carboxylase biotin carboxyl carrier protein
MDTEYIASIIQLFEQSSLSELNITEKDTGISLKREVSSGAAPVLSIPRNAEPVEESSREQQDDTIMIPSPIVGTFYRTPAPDAPPFAEVGDTVKAGDALCIIEAMKMMNRLEAEFACEIVAFHAEHGTLVEYGAPIIEVKRI